LLVLHFSLLEIIKSDLPLNPETATEAQFSFGQTAGTAIPDTGACYLNRVLPCF